MKKIIILFITFIIFNNLVFSQTEEDKAIFLQNFLRMLYWTDDDSQFFEIDIIGDPYIDNKIANYFEKMEIYSTKVQTRIIAPDNIENCHILYVPSEYDELIPEILTKTINTNIIIVTETQEMIKQGVSITFVFISDNYGNKSLTYQYNKNTITKKDVKISSDFKGFGTLYNEDDE